MSGIHTAQIFGATVRLYDGDELLDEGNRYAVVPEGEFHIVDTWHVAGLRGSGSHDVRLDHVFVPDSRIIAPIGGNETLTPQSRLPLGNRLAYNKAAVAVGIAREPASTPSSIWPPPSNPGLQARACATGPSHNAPSPMPRPV